jgi:hypothetical protein
MSPSKSDDQTRVTPDGMGVKDDASKPQMSLIPGAALIEVGRVLDYGAAKYAPDNWRAGMRTRRLLDAAIRHIYQYADGETLDQETGITHLAHAICNLMFGIVMEQERSDLDDRYRPERK